MTVGKNREVIAIHKMPCGGILKCYETTEGREYWYENKLVWKPSNAHRVVLLQAILIEDEFKYGEKQ